ncbi:hypothetical protein Bpfe_030325 [Biomphalaria pfeifferi]|uniref:Uncharacterized protein n=1 Tax=Biomphalaria pfeifferi TaxID=112525 RepID=A0AAD8APV3_BIOPF|nr:hypothetical protein Bpfe_030325 [Biomphalaria pfeifferi]
MSWSQDQRVIPVKNHVTNGTDSSETHILCTCDVYSLELSEETAGDRVHFSSSPFKLFYWTLPLERYTLRPASLQTFHSLQIQTNR